MNKLLLAIIVFFAIQPLGECAPPSRTFNYTAGTEIEPDEVTTNEDNIYTYLQSGVDTIANNSVETADIQNAAITAAKLATGAGTTTVILDGTILNEDVSSSAALALSKLASGTSGQIIVANGSGVPTYVSMSGDATIAAGGALTFGSGSVAADELAATITLSDGDLLDLSSINTSSSSEGFQLPQATSCASGTAEGQLCWDTNDDALYAGTGSSAIFQDFIKGWGNINMATSTVSDGYNIDSVTDNGNCDMTVTWDVNFGSADYACIIAIEGVYHHRVQSIAAGSCRVDCLDSGHGAESDKDNFMIIGVGDR